RRNRLSASHDTSIFHLVFRAHMGDHRQTAIAPQLVSRAKAVWRIDRGHDQFYERGCQDKCPTADGPPGLCWQPAFVSVETIRCSLRFENSLSFVIAS